jgi:hypothetical protein
MHDVNIKGFFIKKIKIRNGERYYLMIIDFMIIIVNSVNFNSVIIDIRIQIVTIF